MLTGASHDLDADVWALATSRIGAVEQSTRDLLAARGWPAVAFEADIVDGAVFARARGLLARVNHDRTPVQRSSVQELFADAAAEHASCAAFSPVGFTEPASKWAEQNSVPLFSFDVTGVPQAQNIVALDLRRVALPGPTLPELGWLQVSASLQQLQSGDRNQLWLHLDGATAAVLDLVLRLALRETTSPPAIDRAVELSAAELNNEFFELGSASSEPAGALLVVTDCSALTRRGSRKVMNWLTAQSTDRCRMVLSAGPAYDPPTWLTALAQPSGVHARTVLVRAVSLETPVSESAFEQFYDEVLVRDHPVDTQTEDLRGRWRAEYQRLQQGFQR
jgi:hypothetical protein